MKGELHGKHLPQPLHEYFAHGVVKELSYSTNDEGDQVIAVTLTYQYMTLQILIDCDDEKHSMKFVVTHKGRET